MYPPPKFSDLKQKSFYNPLMFLQIDGVQLGNFSVGFSGVSCAIAVWIMIIGDVQQRC